MKTCSHLNNGSCGLGRFGGRPSLGTCMSVCDIGLAIEWPTVEGVPGPAEGYPPISGWPWDKSCCGSGPPTEQSRIGP